LTLNHVFVSIQIASLVIFEEMRLLRGEKSRFKSSMHHCENDLNENNDMIESV
jgi:hypothetical protein